MSAELSVVIPAYQEEENLRLLLPRLKKALDQSHISYEVLIVDTEKPLDKTAEVCQENQVQYVPRTGGNMYGDAVRTGIHSANGEYVLFMDADGSHTPEYLPELLVHRKNYDVVIASRYTQGGATENSFVLILMSKIVNLVYSLVLGLKCKDVSNSFKIYRATQLKEIELYCQNFDVVEEILFKLHKKFHVSIKEVPFTFKKRMFGESKRNLVVFIITYVFTLLKLRFGK